jgi:hypothetical protein
MAVYVDLRGVQRPEFSGRTLPDGINCVLLDPPSCAHVWTGTEWIDPEFMLRTQARLSAQAQELLKKTDHVEYRIATPERTPSFAWLAWREQLREVVRGVRMEIQEEPQRYRDAPAAPLMPADLAALALPDESLADLKTRLLTELTTLRSMAVGQIPMTDEQRAMLTTLEGQVAQQWFTS